MTVVRVGTFVRIAGRAAGFAIVALCALNSSASAFPSWKIGRTPGHGPLFAVSCTSRSACTAIGLRKQTTDSDTGTPLVERWNGSRWQIEGTPIIRRATRSQFDGVSCASSTSCIATGSADRRPLAESWNGTSWTILPTARVKVKGVISRFLRAVSCPSLTQCIAVGGFTVATNPAHLFSERWNGERWSVVRIGDPRGSVESSLTGLSCSSPKACTAVGSAQYPVAATPMNPFPEPRVAMLVERWNGRRWSEQMIAGPAGDYQDSLSNVSCTGKRVCVAVGDFVASPSTGTAALIESWNGSRWSIEQSPTEGPSLAGVSCISRTACTAVGFGPLGPLAERWNGVAWTVQSAPAPLGEPNGLGSVSCTSATACMAVGSFGTDDDSLTFPLAERYS